MNLVQMSRSLRPRGLSIMFNRLSPPRSAESFLHPMRPRPGTQPTPARHHTAQDDIDQHRGVGTDPLGLAADALEGPVAIAPVGAGHVLGDGGRPVRAQTATVAGDPLAAVELYYLPALFDFDKPGSRDITETVSALAHMARFIIADISEAKSIPQELERIVRDLPSVPVQPLLKSSQAEYGMFEHFVRYPWVLPPFLYKDNITLLKALDRKVIGPAETYVKTQMQKSTVWHQRRSGANALARFSHVTGVWGFILGDRKVIENHPAMPAPGTVRPLVTRRNAVDRPSIIG
jgi:hypothetical protein